MEYTINHRESDSGRTSLARIAVICNKTPPQVCGIGDHSLCLAAALRELGFHIDVFGTSSVSCAHSAWSDGWLGQLRKLIDDAGVDAVLLQYTPLMYPSLNRRENVAIVQFWGDLCQAYRGTLIVHESYYRLWRRPRTWIRGTRQRRILERLVQATSGAIISAWEPLIQRCRKWGIPNERRHVIPIGSNFPLVNTTAVAERSRLGISAGSHVLCMLGGGEALRQRASLVNSVDQEVVRQRINATWLLLGRIDPRWFNIKRPVICPGIVSHDEVSRCLTATDLFLVPHAGGVCAKRSSVVAALQHGLPIVATAGYQTENSWHRQTGIELTHEDASAFASSVVSLLANAERRVVMSAENYQLFDTTYSWSCIAKRIAAALDSE